MPRINAHLSPRHRRAPVAVERPRRFGEYLVAAEVVDRFQLFRALQLRDRHPGPLGACLAELGYVPVITIERLYEQFASANRRSRRSDL